MLLVLQFILLVGYINKINSLLEKFFLFFKEGNRQVNFQSIFTKTPFAEIGKLADEVVQELSKSKIDAQYHYQYLNIVFEHIPIGLISINTIGEIEFSNSAFRQMFQVNSPKHLHEIKIANIKNIALDLKPGQQILEKYKYEGKVDFVSIKCSQFKIGTIDKKLLSFQSIKQDIEAKEVESWQRFSRVLSHEIMNSVTPIISLSRHLLDQLVQEDTRRDDLTDKTVEGLKIIEERSTGLKEFVSNYRSLSQDLTLSIEEFSIFEVAEEMAMFFHELFKTYAITYQIEVNPETLSIKADRKLLTQVIINLMKNAIESLADSSGKSIILNAYIDEFGQKTIQIVDNGSGINSEDIDNLFIPYYSKKKGGSGIGLSLSRHIINQHGGTLEVSSVPNSSTAFTIKL